MAWYDSILGTGQSGSSDRLGQILDLGGNLAGSYGAGRAAGRAAESTANNQYDLLRLAAARLNLDAPSARARNSVRGDVLANARPVSVSGPITGTHGQIPQISGGLSPALFSQNTRDLGGQMSRDALLSQMQGGGDFQPQAQPQSTGLDKLLTGLGIGGQLVNIGRQVFGNKQTQNPNLQAAINAPYPTLNGPIGGNVRGGQVPMMPWQGSFGGMRL